MRAACQRGDFACPRLCFPRSATTRAVAVLRVCGACYGPCMALCALQQVPRCCPVALMSCSRRVELTCCVTFLSASMRGHSLYELRHRSLRGHSGHSVQSGSFCRGTFPAPGRLTARDSSLAADDDSRQRRPAQRLCRLVAVPYTPTGALPAGPPILHFSDA